jgi:dTDP-6-deoxy-L-talose 4-dehydrogenase (NAD+)
MKKVLVTGASGFIGNHVVAKLLESGVAVIASSKTKQKAEASDWFNKVAYVELDLAAIDTQYNYFEYFDRPDAIVHLAWEGLPNYKSLFHIEENLPRHYNFLRNLAVNGCKDFTVVGTCFEYGMQEGALGEDTCAIPDNPYGVAKYCLNLFLNELAKKEKFVLKWPRLFYLYGRGQNPNALIPQLEAAIRANQPAFNMSGGEQVRDYLPVEEAAAYLVKIALQNKHRGVINCCSGNPIKLKDFVRNYLVASEKNIRLNLGYYPYPDYEPMAFWGDNEKLKTILNEQ